MIYTARTYDTTTVRNTRTGWWMGGCVASGKWPRIRFCSVDDGEVESYASSSITGVHNNQDLILCVKIGICMFF